MIQAKKKIKEKKDDTTAKQSNHQKQKSISSYFATSVTKDTSFSRSESSDENLKRKLESFKHDELNGDHLDKDHSSAPEPLVDSPKKSKMESVIIGKNQVEKSAAAIVKTNSSAKKLTPLEQQVKALKEKYQDTLLMVECGKKNLKNLEPTKIKDFFSTFLYLFYRLSISVFWPRCRKGRQDFRHYCSSRFCWKWPFRFNSQRSYTSRT